MIAYAFLQHRRLANAGRKKKNLRASASANHASRTSRHRRSHPSAAVSALPILPKANPWKTAAKTQSAKVVLA